MCLYKSGFNFKAHNLCFELNSERVNAALGAVLDVLYSVGGPRFDIFWIRACMYLRNEHI